MTDFDFQPYRDFVLRHYGKQLVLYTPTDASLPLPVGMSFQPDQRMDRTESLPKRTVELLPVLDGLRKYGLGDQKEHVLLSGRPGSGKSTALQQLRLVLAAEGGVPVLVQLKGDRSIPEMIQGEFRWAQQRVTLEQVDDWLLADRLILLLDGVNEIPTDDLRRDLAGFREQNSKVPMIFTTRDLALGGDLGISKKLEMKPLTMLQMQEFVGQRLPEVGQKLLEQLGDRLREIAETPLLLKMLCDVFSQTGQIPENKGELFRFFDREYEKFKGLPAVSADFRRFKSEILQHLAFVMMTGDASKPTEFWLTIDRGLAEREIEKFLIDRVNDPAVKAKEWLEDLLENHLLQVAADARQVEFYHQLFQEYYSAEKLLSMFYDGHPDVTNKQRFQHFYLNYLKWTESLRFLVGLLDNEDQVARLVAEGLEVDWFLGASLAGETKQKFQEHTIRLVSQLIDEIEMPECLKIILLEKTQSTFDADNLVPSLRNTGLFMTIQDEYSFIEEITINKLLDGIVEKRDCACQRCIDIRRSAINKIGSMGNTSAIPIVLSFLRDPDQGVRVSAVKTVGILGDENNISDLLHLFQDSDSYIRYTTVIAIWELGIKSTYLSELNQMIRALEYNEAARLIFAIQDKYKLYNYDISCVSIPPIHPPGTTVNHIQSVGNMNTGPVNIEGNQIGETR
jgi:energy-coupling factor transporter ATP-binding protein EcfA2